MVKGNWERRAELAALRRTNNRADKQSKKAGLLKGTAEAAASKLVADTRLQMAILSAWLVASSESCTEDTAQESVHSSSSYNICTSHFRSFEGCSAKRCKKAHPEVTVGHLRTLQPDTGSGSGTEVPLIGPLSLREVPPGSYSSIHFLSCDGRCVYDWQHASTWRNYQQEQEQHRALTKATAGLKLAHLVEGNEGDTEGDEGEEESDELADDGEEEEEEGEREGSAYETGGEEGSPSAAPSQALQGPLHAQLLSGQHAGNPARSNALALVCSFLDTASVACLKLSSTWAKRGVQGDTLSRRRVREASDAWIAKQAKLRREAKRKKQKQGHMNVTDKKDGFKSKYCSKR